jgi:hypothetical protein
MPRIIEASAMPLVFAFTGYAAGGGGNPGGGA